MTCEPCQRGEHALCPIFICHCLHLPSSPDNREPRSYITDHDILWDAGFAGPDLNSTGGTNA